MREFNKEMLWTEFTRNNREEPHRDARRETVCQKQRMKLMSQTESLDLHTVMKHQSQQTEETKCQWDEAVRNRSVGVPLSE